MSYNQLQQATRHRYAAPFGCARRYTNKGPNMNRVLILCILTLLSGCSTNMVKYEDSRPVPVDEREAAYEQYSQQSEKSGIVIVVRDSGFMGSAGDVDFLINDEKVGELSTKESMKLYLEPGRYSISAKGSQLRTKSLSVEPNNTYYFRISIVTERGLVLEQVVSL